MPDQSSRSAAIRRIAILENLQGRPVPLQSTGGGDDGESALKLQDEGRDWFSLGPSSASTAILDAADCMTESELTSLVSRLQSRKRTKLAEDRMRRALLHSFLTTMRDSSRTMAEALQRDLANLEIDLIRVEQDVNAEEPSRAPDPSVPVSDRSIENRAIVSDDQFAALCALYDSGVRQPLRPSASLRDDTGDRPHPLEGSTMIASVERALVQVSRYSKVVRKACLDTRPGIVLCLTSEESHGLVFSGASDGWIRAHSLRRAGAAAAAARRESTGWTYGRREASPFRIPPLLQCPTGAAVLGASVASAGAGTLATGNAVGGVALWDIVTGCVQLQIGLEHTLPCGSVAFNPRSTSRGHVSGCAYASASLDGTVKIWTGSCRSSVLTIPIEAIGAPGRVAAHDVAFGALPRSSAGVSAPLNVQAHRDFQIAVAAHDGTVREYDLRRPTSAPMHVYGLGDSSRRANCFAHSVAYTSCGRLVAASTDAKVRIWGNPGAGPTGAMASAQERSPVMLFGSHSNVLGRVGLAVSHASQGGAETGADEGDAGYVACGSETDGRVAIYHTQLSGIPVTGCNVVAGPGLAVCPPLEPSAATVTAVEWCGAAVHAYGGALRPSGADGLAFVASSSSGETEAFALQRGDSVLVN